VDARKQRFEAQDLPQLMRGARSVLVAKGKKSWRFEPAEGGDVWERLAAVAIGPTGNLRAPTLKLGSRWIVGFGEPTWSEELGG
jgi:hypothetical protein